VFLVVTVLAAIDVAFDLREGATLGHVAIEAGIVLSGMAGAVAMVRRLRLVIRSSREARADAVRLAGQLRATEVEATRWRAEAEELLTGLGTVIDRQFERWGLSPAEREVALLLLKGLSHKELAEVRSITEATARQQARAVYKKAGLSGRHDLAAFFLEDLLLPQQGPRAS
jgi:DNA-binding CsgD family transcriptional regulator